MDIKTLIKKLDINVHHVFIMISAIIASAFIDLIGGGIVGIIIFAIFVGTITEIGYCIIPPKTVKVFGITFQLPDFKKFKVDCENDKFNYYHNLDNTSLWYNIAGIILFFLIKLLIHIF